MEFIRKKSVILADGSFPTAPLPLAALHQAKRIICCDGAADKLLEHGLEPNWIVGDCDSLSADTRTQYAHCLVRIEEQQTNDLHKAFSFCMSKKWRDIVIVGATGLREDHTLGNLAHLTDFAIQATVVLLTDTGWFTPLSSSAHLRSSPGQPVSIFSFDPDVTVYAEGLKYPLDQVRFTRWWSATLNEALGESFKLVFQGGPLLVYQSYVDEQPPL